MVRAICQNPQDSGNSRMKMIVLANNEGREELLSKGLTEGSEVVWIDRMEAFHDHGGADAYIDLLFEDHAEHAGILHELLPATVIVSSVVSTLQEISPDFIRINGWSGFLRDGLIEAAASSGLKEKAEAVFACFHKKAEWVDDLPGFITARIVSMIINEAFLAFDEHVSSKSAIDTAMKLGTNYPFGPFEWADRIGRNKVVLLLQKLAAKEKRYQPAASLSI